MSQSSAGKGAQALRPFQVIHSSLRSAGFGGLGRGAMRSPNIACETNNSECDLLLHILDETPSPPRPDPTVAMRTRLPAHLDLLLLCVQHVRVDGEGSQHAHHQLLLHEPRAQLGFGSLEAGQLVHRLLQLLLPLGCRLAGSFPPAI